MEVYLAKDWRGTHVYKTEPKLLGNLSAFPPTWSGHELKCFNVNGSFTEDEILRNQFIKRNIWWSIVHIYG